jgi:hypothetical protein
LRSPFDDLQCARTHPAQRDGYNHGSRRRQSAPIFPQTEFLRDLGVADVFGMNMQTSALIKTRIHPTATGLAGAFLLVLLTLTASAQRNEILPTGGVDPMTGQLIPVEPVQLDPRLDELRLGVDFDNRGLTDILATIQHVPGFPELNFVMSPRLMDSPVITLKLRSASLRDILMAIGVATDGQVWFEVLAPTLVALVPNPTAAPAETRQPPAHQVVNLREILEVREPALLEEAIITINHLVRETLATIHGSPALAPKLNYHPGSGVLVIVGQRDAIRITMDIIQNLRPHYRQPRETPPEPESDRE